ncbi:dynamin family protein [Oceanicola sp. D3]|uniref:dynamin family protein n=1 Tax=Oceanicola sp. D3 TaxID=2587163 RepID=UPI00143E045E|nr:dynamin family protein [Oceanicola sp. D3]
MLVQNIEVEDASDAERKPVRVVVCGEVSAGKSTVLNALLRARVLPDNIGQTVRPVVTVSHRAETGVEAVDQDGEARSAELNGGTKIFHDAAEVRLWSDHAHLSGLEIVEVPLTKAEELTEEQVALIRSADVMVWVTIASQAWRLTEKTIVEQLGSARPKHAILAVTRGDKLRNDRDRTRLRERMVRETEHFFQEWVFIKGARRKLDKSAKCDKAWDETGGAEMMEAIELLAERVRREPPVEVEAEETAEAESAAVVAEPEGNAAPEASEPQAAVEEPAQAPAGARARVVDFSSYRAAATEQPAAAEKAKPTAPETAAARAAVAAETEENPGLAQMAAAMKGVMVLALRPQDAPEAIEVTFGDEDQARELGLFCSGLQANLGDTLKIMDGEGVVSAFTLSTTGRRVLFEEIPGIGLLYLMADGAVMSHGIASTFFSRVCRKLKSEG